MLILYYRLISTYDVLKFDKKFEDMELLLSLISTYDVLKFCATGESGIPLK